MPEGQVKWFNAKKGYGFVLGPDGQDVFIHYSQICVDGFKTLKEKQRVSYDLVHTEKGFQAQNVTPILSKAEAAPPSRS
ncbi:MAG: cold shock domain-containing protein [Phycisphaeraceae bacterium]|nr:cold shock domain-containing protein [Phycisphaeraceae bacterium]